MLHVAAADLKQQSRGAHSQADEQGPVTCMPYTVLHLTGNITSEDFLAFERVYLKLAIASCGRFSSSARVYECNRSIMYMVYIYQELELLIFK